MAQPEKRENSVLFSLRELRQIEEKRVEEEVSAERSAEEARIRAKMEDDRRKREEEEAKVRAQEDAERRIRDEHDSKIRAEQHRLQEAETRARVDAQANLDAQRLQHEMELRRHEVSKKRPVGLMVVAGVLLLAIGGLGIFLYQKNQEANEKDAKIAQLKADQQRSDDALAALQTQLTDLNGQLSDLNKNIDKATSALADAQNDADRQKARDNLASLQKRREAIADQVAAKSKEQAAKAKENAKIKLNQKCLDNPLGC